MIELQDFTDLDFDMLKSWISSEEELFQFAGPIFTHPLTNEQLRRYIDVKYRKVLKVVFTETGEHIGHCEFNSENGNNRLSRILIGNTALRGKQIGEAVVRKMVNILFENPDIKEVDLKVFEWNKAAIRCYEKVGFEIDHSKTDKFPVKDEFWVQFYMTLRR